MPKSKPKPAAAATAAVQGYELSAGDSGVPSRVRRRRSGGRRDIRPSVACDLGGSAVTFQPPRKIVDKNGEYEESDRQWEEFKRRAKKLSTTDITDTASERSERSERSDRSDRSDRSEQSDGASIADDSDLDLDLNDEHNDEHNDYVDYVDCSSPGVERYNHPYKEPPFCLRNVYKYRKVAKAKDAPRRPTYAVPVTLCRDFDF